MTRKDIIRMAWEAELTQVIKEHNDGITTLEIPHLSKLLMFADLVAAAEREACAALIEKITKSDLITRDDFTHFICKNTAEALAMCIRNKDVFVWPPKNGGE